MKLNRRRYLAAVGTTASALALAGCSESDSGDSGSGGSDSNGQPDVELLTHEFFEDEFSSGVRGTAVNNADSALSYVEAEAVFLDNSGTQIGDGLDNVNDLAADREWEFECLFLGDDPSRIADYEIEVSSGF